MSKNICDWEPESLKDLPCDWQPHIKPVTGDNLKDALGQIKDWDVGGLTGKVTFVNNKTGVGRVYQANAAKGIFEPVSDWIYVK